MTVADGDFNRTIAAGPNYSSTLHRNHTNTSAVATLPRASSIFRRKFSVNRHSGRPPRIGLVFQPQFYCIVSFSSTISNYSLDDSGGAATEARPLATPAGATAYSFSGGAAAITIDSRRSRRLTPSGGLNGTHICGFEIAWVSGKPSQLASDVAGD